MNPVKTTPDYRPRPQLERMQRTVGKGLRVALGILCAMTLLLAVSMQMQSGEPVTKLDIATMAALATMGVFLAIPGRAVSKLRQKALALGFGLAIACLLLEVFVRVFNPFPILLRAGRIDLPRNVTKEFTTDGQVIDVAKQLPKSSRYFYDLTHYNLAGAAEVAEIVYRDLANVTHFVRLTETR